MTNRKPGPPVNPGLDAAFRKWADADKREQKRALQDRIRRLRGQDEPDPGMALLRVIAGKDGNA